MAVREASTTANLAGKRIYSAVVELKYYQQRGEIPDIEF